MDKAQEKMDKVILEPENTLMGTFQKELIYAISEMFDNADHLGIYPTTKFFIRLDNCVRQIIEQLGYRKPVGSPDIREEVKCNTCEYCVASPLYRGVCTKVEPNHIFTEEDRQKWFVNHLIPDWCPLSVLPQGEPPKNEEKE